jgi:hypothetical protein
MKVRLDTTNVAGKQAKIEVTAVRSRKFVDGIRWRRSNLT